MLDHLLVISSLIGYSNRSVGFILLKNRHAQDAINLKTRRKS